MKLAWILALALTSSCAATATPPPASSASKIVMGAALSGALNRKVALSHALDAANQCNVAGAPAIHYATQGEVVEVPPGPPTYRLSINQAGVQISISAMPYSLSQATFDDESNANLRISTPEGVWMLPHQNDPGASIHLTFAADGQSGTVEAKGLVAMRDNAPDSNGKRLDVSGRWRCSVG